jgi:hypothetical protein
LVGANDNVYIDLSFLNSSAQIPDEVVFNLASFNLSVSSLDVKGFHNGSTLCVATLNVASSQLLVDMDLIFSDGGRIVVQNDSTLLVRQTINSSSDQELVFRGSASILGAVNLSHQSGVVAAAADFSISGGFFGIMHLVGRGTKQISGNNCTFVEFNTAAPFTLACNTSTVYNMVVEKEASSALIVGDFRVAPDPEAKGPSGSAVFYAPVSFVGNFSVVSSADAEFYEPLEITNASVYAADDSVLFFGFTNTLSISQDFLVFGRAQLALYCPVSVSGCAFILRHRCDKTLT